MKILIPARGGSKGIINKNIKMLNGKPLIAYTIESALESKIDKIIVSTDSEKIAKIDFNHPLAGQDLTFDVKIISVTPKQPSVR